MAEDEGKTAEELAAEKAAGEKAAGEKAAEDSTDYKAEAEKWKTASRKYEAQAKVNADAAKRLKEAEDADKSEVTKAQERAAAEQKRADEAEARVLRLEVAGSKGLTPAQAKRLVGSTVEELEADADELLASFKSADKDGEGSDTDGSSGKPKEKLRGGASSPDAPDDIDPAAAAAKIPRGQVF